jgi:hypothetical protein
LEFGYEAIFNPCLCCLLDLLGLNFRFHLLAKAFEIFKCSCNSLGDSAMRTTSSANKRLFINLARWPFRIAVGKWYKREMLETTKINVWKGWKYNVSRLLKKTLLTFEVRVIPLLLSKSFKILFIICICVVYTKQTNTDDEQYLTV